MNPYRPTHHSRSDLDLIGPERPYHPNPEYEVSFDEPGNRSKPNAEIIEKHIGKLYRSKLENLLLGAVRGEDVHSTLVPAIRDAIQDSINRLVDMPGFNTECAQWKNQEKEVAEEKEPHLKKFDKFSEFPAEIRLKIYSFISPSNPRIVSLSKDSMFDMYYTPHAMRSTLAHPNSMISCNITPPVTFGISQESRAEALKEWKPCFSMHRGLINAGNPRIYVNFEKDIICLKALQDSIHPGHNPYPDANLLEVIAQTGDAGKIQNLVCSHSELLYLLTQPLFIYSFKGLKTIYVDLEADAVVMAAPLVQTAASMAAARQRQFPFHGHASFVPGPNINNPPFGPFPAPPLAQMGNTVRHPFGRPQIPFNHIRESPLELHNSKVMKMKDPEWVDETNPTDQIKAVLINDSYDALTEVTKQHPDFVAPNLKFGFIWRKELNDLAATFLADKENVVERIEPRSRMAQEQYEEIMVLRSKGKEIKKGEEKKKNDAKETVEVEKKEEGAEKKEEGAEKKERAGEKKGIFGRYDHHTKTVLLKFALGEESEAEKTKKEVEKKKDGEEVEKKEEGSDKDENAKEN